MHIFFSLDLENQFKAFREKAKMAMPGSDWSPIELTQGLPPERADIVIVGGGVIGWSIAYWLKRKLRSQDSLRVLLVEKDPTVSLSHLSCMHLQSSAFSSYFSFPPFFSSQYSQASTVLSAGGIRQQFSLKENIQLSLASANFLKNINVILHCSTHEFIRNTQDVILALTRPPS